MSINQPLTRSSKKIIFSVCRDHPNFPAKLETLAGPGLLSSVNVTEAASDSWLCQTHVTWGLSNVKLTICIEECQCVTSESWSCYKVSWSWRFARPVKRQPLLWHRDTTWTEGLTRMIISPKGLIMSDHVLNPLDFANLHHSHWIRCLHLEGCLMVYTTFVVYTMR
jgi:hypothetical protein